MNALKKFIRDKLFAESSEASATKVVSVPGGFAVERSSADGLSVRLEVHAYGGLTVLDLAKIDPTESKPWQVDMRSSAAFPEVEPSRDVFPVCFETFGDAKSVYDSIKKSIFASSRISLKILRGLAIAVIIALVVILVLPTPSPTTVAQAPAVSQQPVSPASVVSEDAPQEAKLTEEERLKVLSAKGVIQYSGQGAPFYLFSDPNCPYCKKQEAELVSVDPSFKPVIFPLGYKPGSRDLASAIMCSADPVKAWRSWMVDGAKPTALACDKGYDAVDANMRLFESLRLNGTPSTITPKGWILSGFASAQDLSIILGKQ